MGVELPFATPDFDRIRRDAGIETEDAIRLIWLMLMDEINKRERLAQTVGGTSGHNLLSATHPDTIPDDPIQGDIIVALGSTPVDNGKYWFNGEQVLFEDLNVDTLGLDYWKDGSAFVMGGFGLSSGSGTKWQRKALGAAGTFLGSTGTEADWLDPATSSESASVYRTNNVVIPSATDTAISFEAAHFDTASFWSSVTPTRFTIPTGKGGKYLAIGQLTWQDPGTAAGYRAKIRLNGATIVGEGSNNQTITGEGDTAHQVSAIMNLIAGDYVEIVAHWNYTDVVGKVILGGTYATFGQLLKVG